MCVVFAIREQDAADLEFSPTEDTKPKDALASANCNDNLNGHDIVVVFHHLSIFRSPR